MVAVVFDFFPGMINTFIHTLVGFEWSILMVTRSFYFIGGGGSDGSEVDELVYFVE